MNAALNWSFSKLMVYEQCPLHFKFAKIDRVPEPPRKPNDPLERGNRIHKRLECYVQGTGPMDTEAKSIAKFEPILTHARELYRVGLATTERDWLFNRDWELCEQSEVWLWAKLDLSVVDEPHQLAIAVDYKSGKSTYKQIEHVQQMQLYAALTALKFEWAQTVIAELYYLDEGWVKSVTYAREDALRFVGRFDRRAQRIYDDKLFRPNPTRMTCKWCPYGVQNGNGHCPVAA